jgi:transposase
MGLHLNVIAKAVAHGAHAMLIVDGAGWHGAKCLQVPDNITFVKLPPYSPELKTMENVCAYQRSKKLAVSVFDTYEEILGKCA